MAASLMCNVTLCTVITCPVLQDPPNGKVSPPPCRDSRSRVGETCYFTCDNTYVQSGPSFKTCLSDGYWTQEKESTVCRGRSASAPNGSNRHLILWRPVKAVVCDSRRNPQPNFGTFLASPSLSDAMGSLEGARDWGVVILGGKERGQLSDE
ncbi:t-SNARE domain-containing protein 1 [Branchiostoma belcheri]|nr:t-SNARE domain-containing protein 1 [Branchiostoma belcheri]